MDFEINNMSDLKKVFSDFRKEIDSLKEGAKNELELKEESVSSDGSSTTETIKEGTNATSSDSSDENITDARKSEIAEVLGIDLE